LISDSFAFQNITSSQGSDPRFSSLSLIGVIVSKDSSSSLAILKDKRSGDTMMLKIGERILDLELTHIFKNRIVLQKNNSTFQIFLGRGNIVNLREKPKKNPQKTQIPKKAVKRREQLLESGQQEAKVIKKEFNREEILKRLEAEMPMIMKEARFTPNLIEGEMSGIKITRLPRRSVLSMIGINKNDIIKEVNGVELNNMETLFGLFNRFRDDDEFEITLERQKKIYRILYILK
jgi:type II secretion system protein C